MCRFPCKVGTYYFPLIFVRYQKLQSNISSGDDVEETNNVPAKYVILEDMEDEEDGS